MKIGRDSILIREGEGKNLICKIMRDSIGKQKLWKIIVKDHPHRQTHTVNDYFMILWSCSHSKISEAERTIYAMDNSNASMSSYASTLKKSEASEISVAQSVRSASKFYCAVTID